MHHGPTGVVLVSDLNLTNFANILKSQAGPLLNVRVAALDNVVPVLHGLTATDGSAVVWTQPGKVAAGFQRARQFAPVAIDEILSDVDHFAQAIRTAASVLKSVYVPLWQINPAESYGLQEMRHNTGVHGLLLQMNARLSERLADLSNVHLMNSTRWMQGVGTGAWSQRMWYLTKTPFSNEVFLAAAKDLIAHMERSQGLAIKLIVLDLDDTLWGGVVGDDGWQNLHLGGHDPIGESFVDFQRTLKALKDRGILLAIASKNEESVALEAMEKHPEMILRRTDMVAIRIDWNDKASNIQSIIQELNLGARSVMFIDDNPVERSRVKEFLPEVFVPDWPENKLLYTEKLRSLPVFNLDAISAEDLARTQMYQEEVVRERSKAAFGEVEAWLRSLETTVTAARVDEGDFARVHQLFGKTNQFNLSTWRPSEKELCERMQQPSYQLWSFRVNDRFGDAGLTGVVGLDLSDPQSAVISDLILSCRVMGRQVEETLLHVAFVMAELADKVRIEAHFKPTAKNKPCLDFMLRSGFDSSGEGPTFTWSMDRPYPCPTSLKLLMK
jgi:FkbH-like protein